MDSSTRQVGIYIGHDKVKLIFGGICNIKVTFQSGASIWVPAQPQQHQLRGLRYDAMGSPQQLQQLAAELLSQCWPSFSAADVDEKQWCYLNNQDASFGPFSARQLQKFNSSGVWKADFQICHNPSSIWLPIWLVLRLMELPAIQKHPTHTPEALASSAGLAQGPPAAATASAKQRRPHELNSCGANSSIVQGDGGRSSRTRNVQLDKAQEPAGSHKRQRQRAPQPPPECAATLGSGAAFDGSDDTDAEMTDVDKQITQQIARLRQDGEYVNALNKAMAMDWSSDDQEGLNSSHTQQQQLVDPLDPPATALAGQRCSSDACSGWPSSMSMMARGEQQARPLLMLTLVVDTNVLLHGPGLLLLKQLQEAYCRQHLPEEQQQQLLPAQEQGWLQVHVFIPWAVLVELDRLKSRQSAAGEDSPQVPAAARAALRHLQAAMAPGSACRSMYQAQTVQEFRAAAHEQDFGVPDKTLSADDRILQATLSRRAKLHCWQQQQAVGCFCEVLLLTNDTAFRLKAQANDVPVASLWELAKLPGQHSQMLLDRLLQLSGMAANSISRSNASAQPAASSPATATTTAGKLPNSHLPCGAQAVTGVTAVQFSVPSVLPAEAVTGLKAAGASASSGYHSGASRTPTAAPAAAAAGRAGAAAVGSRQAEEHDEQSEARYAAAALHCLTQLREALSDRVTRMLQQEYEELWLDVICRKPPWNDNAFLHVLSKHWRSTLQEHLTGSAKSKRRELEAAVAQLLVLSKQLKHPQQNQLPPHRLHGQVVAHVVNMLKAFGAHGAAEEVAAAAASMASACAAGGGASGAGSSKAAKAPYAAQEDVAGDIHSITGGAANPPASSLHHHHHQQQHWHHSQLEAAEQQLQQQPPQQHVSCVPAQLMVQQQACPEAAYQEFGQQQRQQHQVHQLIHQQVPSQLLQQSELHLQQQPHSHVLQQPYQPLHQQEQQPVAALAATTAPVPAPQLQGPCLRLSQLMQYSIHLLQAAVPLLQQWANLPAGSEAACVVMTVGQQLQQTVHLLEQVSNCWAPQQLQQAQMALAMQQQPIVQAGLLLVDLCSLLLGNAAAGATVASQLVAHAELYAADAAEWLRGRQQGSAAPGDLLQQLKLAAQVLQGLPVLAG